MNKNLGPQFVNMDRNQPLKSSLEVNPSMGYRMLGQGGYDDFQATGTIRAREGGHYDTPYFGDAPLQRYAARQGTHDYVAEVPRHLLQDASGYLTPQGRASSIPGDAANIYRIDRKTGEHERIHGDHS